MEIVRKVCDIHMARNEMTDALGTTTITVDKRTILIDLCNECKGGIETNLAEAFKIGRRPDGTPARGVRRTKAQIEADRIAAGGEPAPAVTSDKANKGHGGATYGEYKCDVEGCDREFNTAQGMSMHKIRGHRPKAVADAA